nr:MAG TPA: hypothetical protein [Caudoviricetes sp.]
MSVGARLALPGYAHHQGGHDSDQSGGTRSAAKSWSFLRTTKAAMIVTRAVDGHEPNSVRSTLKT